MILRCALLLVLTWGAIRAQSPRVGSCPVFPPDNIWNTAIDQLPVHARSDAYVASIGGDKPLHADFGAGLYKEKPIGIPFVIVPQGQKRVGMSFVYREHSDLGRYPIPPNAPIEGGNDRHVIVIEDCTCMMYELWHGEPQPDGSWNAGGGVMWDLTSNGLRPDTFSSVDAAGLPIFPGLARYEEVAEGAIRHALRFTAPRTQRAYVWPARHYASKLQDLDLPPLGIRMRLKASVNISALPPQARVIAQALKTYGMMLADNGSPWFLSGAPNEKWNNNQMDQLKTLKGSDFEAVNVGSIGLSLHSGRAILPNTCAVGAASSPAR